MKKCPSCGIQYQDSQGFCTKCGTKLVSMNPTFEPINPIPEAKKHLDPSDWGGAALAIIGLLFFWFDENVGLDFIFAVVGIIYGRQSRNTFFRIAAYVIGGITVLLTALIVLANLTA